MDELINAMDCDGEEFSISVHTQSDETVVRFESAVNESLLVLLVTFSNANINACSYNRSVLSFTGEG